MNRVPENVFLIGIGGIGMSALARYFKHSGAVVSGYDKTPTALTRQLENEGIAVHFADDIALLDKNAHLVIYTPAIPAGHTQLNYYREHNYNLKKRSQVLGELTQNYFTIAVGGSHGKTTTSAMIAWILKASGYDCTAFLGGICINFESNFIAGNNRVMVVEADEFDRSFHTLHPDIAVVTAIDSDHLEVYGTKAELEKNFLVFANQIHPEGLLVYKHHVHALDAYAGRKITYSLDANDQCLSAYNYVVHTGGSDITLNNGFSFHLQYPGLHNIENAIAAVGVTMELGIPPEKIAAALSAFKGIHRRFEVAFNDGETVLIDDYAHHPAEISMFLSSVRAIYPHLPIHVVFQPHLFTRTRDLADEFAASLDLADEVILLPIYPARELPIPGVSSETITRLMKKPVSIFSKEEVMKHFESTPKGIICTIGAGDIDQLVRPLAELFTKHQWS
jgi:UDP-N-acetylmuramate--alanine ligase